MILGQHAGEERHLFHLQSKIQVWLLIPQKLKLSLYILRGLVPRPLPLIHTDTKILGCSSSLNKMAQINVPHPYTPNCQINTIQIFSGKKKKQAYKWTGAIQICVVEGSTIFSCFDFQLMNRWKLFLYTYLISSHLTPFSHWIMVYNHIIKRRFYLSCCHVFRVLFFILKVWLYSYIECVLEVTVTFF